MLNEFYSSLKCTTDAEKKEKLFIRPTQPQQQRREFY